MPTKEKQPQNRLRIISADTALKKLGLRFFRDDPAKALLQALVGFPKQVELSFPFRWTADEDSPPVPTGFSTLHAGGIGSRCFFSLSNDHSRFGDEVEFGVLWSPRLKTGVVTVDSDGEMSCPLAGLSYSGELKLDYGNLAPLRKILVKDNLGSAAGIERVVNHAPDLFPDSFFVDSYLSRREMYFADDKEPFVLIYKEPLPPVEQGD